MARICWYSCGILASLLYAVADVSGAMRWEAYRYASQSISELSAIGAPSRPLVVPLFAAHDVLLIAFGLGIWRAADRNRALRWTGIFLAALGASSLAAPFTPMHQRGAEVTLTDALHIALTVVNVLLIVLAIGCGAASQGRWFRWYSIGTLLILLTFGTLAGMDGPRIAANLPTPWIGITERINVGSYLLWQTVLAVTLLRNERFTMPESSG